MCIYIDLFISVCVNHFICVCIYMNVCTCEKYCTSRHIHERCQAHHPQLTEGQRFYSKAIKHFSTFLTFIIDFRIVNPIWLHFPMAAMSCVAFVGGGNFPELKRFPQQELLHIRKTILTSNQFPLCTGKNSSKNGDVAFGLQVGI